jgi:excisionase family DNA binding protein
MNEPILVSKKEAARVLSVSLRTVDNLIASKELAVRRLGRRCLIPRRALEEFARRDHATQANDPIASQDRAKEVCNGDRKNIA